jgi:hypothetical protein
LGCGPTVPTRQAGPARRLTRRCSWRAQCGVSWRSAAQSSLALAGRLVPSGGGAPWATVSGQRRSQLSADPLGGSETKR